ncbi:MAG: glucose 1-dehydrogenase [Alphaproteobacteria bacterium]|nr:glucose 1-dehydrogenase [Alphaproteobacteria bacterium]
MDGKPGWWRDALGPLRREGRSAALRAHLPLRPARLGRRGAVVDAAEPGHLGCAHDLGTAVKRAAAMRLQGKVAIVTGAASGFGEGIAKAYAREGARVVVADLDRAGAGRVASEIDAATPGAGGAVAVAGDVTRRADIEAMVDAAAAMGGPDIIVNNAGITHRNGDVLTLDEASFDRIYAVNVKSVFLMTVVAVPLMQKRGRGGSIINVGSTAGIRGRPGLAWYNGTKGAVHTLTQSLALAFAKDNIRVNAVCPVIGATGLTGAFMGMPDTPENREKFLATIPLGRMSTPADIANACLWLAEDASSFITGVLLPVDGGRLA